MDRGPWIVENEGRTLQSDDFNFDVALRLSGDFASDAQRTEYANWLAARLNALPHPAHITDDTLSDLARQLATAASESHSKNLVPIFFRMLHQTLMSTASQKP